LFQIAARLETVQLIIEIPYSDNKWVIKTHLSIFYFKGQSLT
jgi:hypothetical protein